MLLLLMFKVRYDDDDDDDGPIPDGALEGGMPLPIRMAAEFPPELVATPIEDIDAFYADKKVTFYSKGDLAGTESYLFCVCRLHLVPHFFGRPKKYEKTPGHSF